jgi:hypothetical protein
VHLREVSLLQFRVRTDGVSGVRFRGKRALIEVKKSKVRTRVSKHEVERRGEEESN